MLGIGSQVFILPYLDSIAEFTILFLAVTFIAAWFATCSPRISYFGVQIVVAFYLINLQEFKIQTSLAVARDRVVGILLGLFMMWLVFDQIWGAPAVIEMKKTFSSALRLLAQFAREPLSKDVRTAIDKSFALRETINATVNQGRALADGILLEFGPSRVQDLALRDRIRAWQAELRTIFINRTVLWKYRMQLPGFELPESLASAQSEFDEQVANTLESMADRFEAKATGSGHSRLEDAFEHLANAVRRQTAAADSQQGSQMRLDTLLKLSRNTEQLLTSLNREI